MLTASASYPSSFEVIYGPLVAQKQKHSHTRNGELDGADLLGRLVFFLCTHLVCSNLSLNTWKKDGALSLSHTLDVIYVSTLLVC